MNIFFNEQNIKYKFNTYKIIKKFLPVLFDFFLMGDNISVESMFCSTVVEASFTDVDS